MVHSGASSGSGADFAVLCDETAFMLRCLLPQVTVVLAPGCPSETRQAVYDACNLPGELTVHVLHAYSTTTCVDQIIVRGSRMRAAAWQYFLTLVDA